MKYIFPDSNIFFDYWHVNSAGFRLLADIIKNSQSVLLMSEMVCSEVQNKHFTEQQDTMAELKKIYEKAQKFNGQRQEESFDHLVQIYDLKKVLKENFGFIEFVPYDMIPQSITAQRAMTRTMPFRGENEKGYRDTLIWLSLLQFLKNKTDTDEVFFITKNKTDFLNRETGSLHEHLTKDLLDLGIKCKVTVFLTLSEFIKAKVEMNEEYTFSNQSISDQLDDLSKEIENDVAFDLDLFTSAGLKDLLDESGLHFRYISTLLNHGFEIFEGMEDGEVVWYKRLTSNTLYVEYSFNLRRCAIELMIPQEDYLHNKSGIETFYNESSIIKGEAHLIKYCRPYFKVNLVYDVEKKTISGFELLEMKFM